MGYKHPNLTDARFGKLLVIKRSHRDKFYKWLWECECECGNTTFVSTGALTSGNTKSCGCSKLQGGPKIIDLSGQHFGKLLVKGISQERNKHNRVQHICICDCGREVIVPSFLLIQGHVKTCGKTGCRHKSNGNTHGLTHGMTNERIYTIYHGMLQRCFNVNSEEYKNYGGRGITVCKEWIASFEKFFQDMGHPISASHFLDRIDNNGNYEPSNCRWATQKEQMRNTRNNFEWFIDGKKTCMAELCEEWKLERGRVQYRYDIGWAAACCLFLPSILGLNKKDQKYISNLAKNKKQLNSLGY